jgi:predicted nucleic acid-binding protein
MNLAVIGRLALIEQLYGSIDIPEAVARELAAALPEQFSEQAIKNLSWLKVHSVKNRPLTESLLLDLDAGEAEAITLSMEMKAGFLLIDERRGRSIAQRFGLKFIGLMGMLIEAKRKGCIPAVKPLLDELIAKEASGWMIACMRGFCRKRESSGHAGNSARVLFLNGKSYRHRVVG